MSEVAGGTLRLLSATFNIIPLIMDHEKRAIRTSRVCPYAKRERRKKEAKAETRESCGVFACIYRYMYVISLVFNKFRIYAECARKVHPPCSLCPVSCPLLAAPCSLLPVSWPEALSINDARKFTLAIIMQLRPVQGYGRLHMLFI